MKQTKMSYDLVFGTLPESFMTALLSLVHRFILILAYDVLIYLGDGNVN